MESGYTGKGKEERLRILLITLYIRLIISCSNDLSYHEIIYSNCVFIYFTWEERGGFMSGGRHILKIRKFLILYTVSLAFAVL